MHSVYDIYMDKCEFESESEVTQACPTLCDPVRCRLPGSSVHGIVQARILEWGAISFSRGIFLTQGLNPCPLQWKHAVLNTGLPVTSL